MAVLTDADIGELWIPFEENYRDIIETEGFWLKGDIAELFQAIEDYHVNMYSSTPLDSIKGFILSELTNWSALTNGFVQPAIAAWQRWKAAALGF